MKMLFGIVGEHSKNILNIYKINQLDSTVKNDFHLYTLHLSICFVTQIGSPWIFYI